jgi:hypothetical protein
MELHIFKCLEDKSAFGFTKDIEGLNLPGNSCKDKWIFWKTVILEREMPFIGGVADQIIDGVNAKGFHVTSTIEQFNDL